ncbi:SLC13 family permease [Nocardioides sp. ChNu-99]|uniref:SLC13 family permease n=1 Tax=Nocardioides sp. ChNu-99 TaxID=2839897 RepID=UPI002406E9CA|nr:SLC13 family permease [Nocardioides sp. ChNu-99]MDF9717309.1 anion permease [Nocardioides sp. ChNu-99]
MSVDVDTRPITVVGEHPPYEEGTRPLPGRPGPRRPGVRVSGRTTWAAALVVDVAALVTVPDGLSLDARLALLAFGVATVLWTLTDLDAGYVALGAGVLATVPVGGQDALFASLGNDVVWLVVGAFVVGGALARSGLAGRLTAAVVGRARTVGGTLWLVTAAIVPLAFLVPSTSGRAAVLLPVHRALGEHLDGPRAASGGGGQRRVTRALALLVPSVVLVSTVGTLVGATSHLVAVDLLHQATGETISYAAWALWGMPFAIAASALTCLAVQLLFLRRDERRRAVVVPAAERAPWSRAERVAGAVLGLALAGWLTEPLHGLEIATVTLLAALALCAPAVGVMTWKEGLGEVSWSLVLFVAGALALGGALVSSGAGDWVVGGLFALSGVAGLTSPLAVVAVLALLSATAHLYVTSHTVRAIALVPPSLYLAASLDLDAVAVVFLVSIGIDYCLTLPVSSKALLVFADADDRGDGFAPRDLLRLSAVLLPAWVALVVVTYEVWWSRTGLAL